MGDLSHPEQPKWCLTSTRARFSVLAVGHGAAVQVLCLFGNKLFQGRGKLKSSGARMDPREAC